jgi:hypothetical protein
MIILLVMKNLMNILLFKIVNYFLENFPEKLFLLI